MPGKNFTWRQRREVRISYQSSKTRRKIFSKAKIPVERLRPSKIEQNSTRLWKLSYFWSPRYSSQGQFWHGNISIARRQTSGKRWELSHPTIFPNPRRRRSPEGTPTVLRAKCYLHQYKNSKRNSCYLRLYNPRRYQNRVTQSSFFSVLANETTDIAGMAQLFLCIR
jgi:hypothetical protein